jgi:hypothetical protein
MTPSGRYALREPYDLAVRTTCERCDLDLLYCDVHDAYFCPTCDWWTDSVCGDPECTHCAGRAVRPSECAHEPDHHFRMHD